MIRFEREDVWGWEHAIRGMRNPLNSWGKSDSKWTHFTATDDVVAEVDFDSHEAFVIGQNDYDLMARLIKGGQPHRKFLRQIFVSVDIIAPLYWWKEFDTYKVGTTANSCSTMHTIHKKEFMLDDFSWEHLAQETMWGTINLLNHFREEYLKTKDKVWWYRMIQFLPSSYNQKRTITMTYENLLNMVEYRRGHKLDEWREFCEWVFTLPNSFILREGLRE